MYTSLFTLFLFLLLPALGLIYSAAPLRTKQNPYLSVVTICAGLVTPITLGYFMNAGDPSGSYFFLVLFLFCLSAVPLKQIEEAELDARCRNPNLYLQYGLRILIWPFSGLSLVFLLTMILDLDPKLKSMMGVFTTSTIVCILMYVGLKKRLQHLYQRVIQLVILEGVVFFLILRVL